jgi:hypothetical protein
MEKIMVFTHGLAKNVQKMKNWLAFKERKSEFFFK